MAEFFLMPQSSPTMEIGKLVAWRVAEGDKVQPQDIIAEVETDKAVAEIEVFDPCFLLKILQPAGSEVPVDTPIAIIGNKADEDISELLKSFAETPVQEKATAEDTEENATEGRIKAGPAARKSATELGVDLEAISGTGPGGRVMRSDVEGSVNSTSKQSVPKGAGLQYFQWKNKAIDESIMEPVVGFTPNAQYPKRRGSTSLSSHSLQAESVPNSMMRKTIAKRLKASYLDAPVFFLNAKVNCNNMVALRTQLKAAGRKVSYNDMVVKAVALALCDVPAVNASWTEEAIVRHGGAHVGVAVALPEGLITPVVFDANNKDIFSISQETRSLAQKAREMKLQPEDYQGSTFTVSNLGMMGIERFTAIINPPNSAILAVGSMQEEPVVNNGSLTIGWRMTVTLTCDHRVIDGALGATYLKALRHYLENPILLLV